MEENNVFETELEKIKEGHRQAKLKYLSDYKPQLLRLVRLASPKCVSVQFVCDRYHKTQLFAHIYAYSKSGNEVKINHEIQRPMFELFNDFIWKGRIVIDMKAETIKVYAVKENEENIQGQSLLSLEPDFVL